MQLYTRNMMAVTAASAVLAAGVVTMPPITADIAAPRVLTADIALVVEIGPINCERYGGCQICTAGGCSFIIPPGTIPPHPIGLFFPPIRYVAAVPAYALTQAAYLASDVVAVAAAGVAYGATSAGTILNRLAYQIQFILQELQNGLPPFPAPPLPVPLVDVPSVQAAAGRLAEEVGQLKTDWANTFSADHFNAYVEGLAGIVIPVVPYQTPDAEPPVPEVASVRSRPVAAVASRARAASVTPRQSPSAKAAAATAETAPTAEQSQRRATRGAAHRTERSGAGRIE
jgi:hypothetical protein